MSEDSFVSFSSSEDSSCSFDSFSNKEEGKEVKEEKKVGEERSFTSFVNGIKKKAKNGVENGAKVFFLLVFLFLCLFVSCPLDVLSFLSDDKIHSPNFAFSPGVNGWSVASPSFLLFPGNPQPHLVILDVVYIIFLLCLPFVFGYVYWRRGWIVYYRKWSLSHVLVKYFAIPLLLLALLFSFHVFGNAHYSYYCVLQVIPKENCFWSFNAFSFVTGTAGIILFAQFAMLASFVLFPFAWCSFKLVRPH